MNDLDYFLGQLNRYIKSTRSDDYYSFSTTKSHKVLHQVSQSDKSKRHCSIF
jgi:hypothetical protein